MKQLIRGAAMVAILTSALCADASTLYWIEASFASPTLVMADASGTVKNTLALAPQSLPQAVAVSTGLGRVFVTELAFLNAHVKYVGIALTDSGSVVSLQSCLRGIAADSAAGKIYWTSTNLGSGSAIYRANFDGSTAEILQTFGAASTHAPYGIAVDGAAQTMYWADFDAGAIMRAQTVAAATPQTILPGLSGPVGVALAPDSGALFWTDANTGTIGRAGLDGSGARTIISGLASPQYCALDRIAARIYWTEFGASRVRSARLDGSDTVTVAATAYPPVGIAVVSEPVVAVRPAAALTVPRTFAMTASTLAAPVRAIRVRFQLPVESRVNLSVSDLRGRRVAVVPAVDNGAGWYVRDIGAAMFAPGVYYVRFTAGTFVSTAACTIAR
jgi:Low-density lipoprotein receptor repeat class B